MKVLDTLRHLAIRVRAIGAALIVLAPLAVAAAPAAATVTPPKLYVAPAPAGSNSGNCQTPAAPCATISYALTQAATDDTINLAAGTYNEDVSVKRLGVTIVGAGSGPSGSTITSSGPVVTLAARGVTLESLRIEQTGTSQGILGAGEPELIDGVAVVMADPLSGAVAVETGPGATVTGTTVSGAWTGQALLANGTATLHGDTLISSRASTQSLATLTGIPHYDTFDIVDTMLYQANAPAPPQYDVEVLGGNLVMDSSLLVGGLSALVVQDESPLHTTIVGSTLDAGTPGVSDPGDSALSFEAANGTTASASLIGSVTVEGQTAQDVDGVATINCSYSDVPSQSQSASGGNGAINCASGSAGNTATSTSAIFADGSGDFTNIPADYTPNASWSGLDSVPASAIVLPAGFAPASTDLLGNPRIVNGYGTCAPALQDKGAIELQVPGPLPVPSIAGPSRGYSGESLTFGGSAPPPTGGSPVAFSWQSSDGGTGTGPSFTHTFTSAGSFTVTLAAAGAPGCVGTAKETVTVIQTPRTTTTRPPAPAPSGNAGGPDNRFVVSHVQIRSGGTVRATVKLPGPGVLDVLETAPMNDLAHAAALLGAGPGRFVFARAHVVVRRAGTITVTVRPGPRGKRLLKHHRYAVVIRQWFSYTPTGGRQRTIGRAGVRIT
jgi:hypothetical protein